jgi:hypothetical protein
LILNSIAKLFILPSAAYISELCFPLDKRFITIGIGFYCQLLGMGLGCVLSSFLLIPDSTVSFFGVLKIQIAVGSFCFFVACLLVKYQPEKRR